MTKKLQKSLQEYLSKIKKQAPHLQFSHSSLSISSTTSRIIAGCKHPKSLSFTLDRKAKKNHHSDQQHHHNEEAAATLEDIDKFLVENFRSLYGEDHDNNKCNNNYHESTRNKKLKEKTQDYQVGPKRSITSLGGVGILFDSPRAFSPPSDLCGSQRFFVSPVSSGSLMEEARVSGMGTTTSASEDGGSTSASTGDSRPRPHNYVKDDTAAIPGGVEDCIALLKVSPSPYEDFRRSMQEVLDAKINNKERVDWDFMEELLFCYLRLNEKKQYRYILSAFVDLVGVMRQIRAIEGQKGHEVTTRI